jgi:hypothetical protein
MFDFFEHYSHLLVDGMHLVLIGTAHVPIPKHPRVHHLGFLEDQDKYDAMAAAEVLIMPSYLESLSMVALEAWAMGKPVLANAKCDVLQGQCLRSNAGLFYANYAEFCETLRAIDTAPSLQSALGRNGRAFFERHYSWPVVIKKYTDMLQQLSRENTSRAMEPLPNWFARRRRNQPPADSVVQQLPTGPYRLRSASSNQQSAIRSQQSAIRSQQSAVGNQQSATGNQRPTSAARARTHQSPGSSPLQGAPSGDKQRADHGKGGGREPFDSAQGKPFDSAQGKPFDSAQGKRVDSAQGNPRPEHRRRPHRRGRRPHGRGGR